MNDINQRLHEAMGRGCWHETEVVASGTNEGNVLECKHCRAYYPNKNPTYDSSLTDAFELVEWMRGRGFWFDLDSRNSRKWTVRLFVNANTLFMLDDESLPRAIALAAIKALNLEEQP